MSFLQNSIKNRLLFIVAASLITSAIAIIVFLNIFTISRSTKYETEKLKTEIDSAILMSARYFNERTYKLESFAKLVEDAISKPDNQKDLQAFNSFVNLNTDNIYRNKKATYNGLIEAGMFFPHNNSLTNSDKIAHARIKQVLDIFGHARICNYENLYFLSLHKTEIAFDKNKPNYVFEMKAHTDLTNTEWIQLGNPKINPKKQVLFTSPIWDSIWQKTMVSAIKPIYKNNTWYGTIGDDIHISDALQILNTKLFRFKNIQHFIIDKNNNFILAGAYQPILQESRETFLQHLQENKSLQNILDIKQQNNAEVVNTNFILNNQRFIAISTNMPTTNWQYTVLIPYNSITENTQSFLLIIALCICIIIAITFFIISRFTSKWITGRITLLTKLFDNYTHNHLELDPKLISSRDEISNAAIAYSHLQLRLSHAFEKIDSDRKLLAKKEEQLSQITENMTDIVFVVNMEMQVVYISPSIEKLTGYSIEEIKSMPFSSRFTPESFEYIISMFQEEMEIENSEHHDKNRTRLYQTEEYKKDGSLLVMSHHTKIIRNSKGVAIGFLGVSRDITELKKIEQELVVAKNVAEEKNKQLVAVFEAIPDLIFRINNKGVFIDYKAEISSLYYQKESIIGKSIFEILPKEIAEITVSNIKKTLDTNTMVYYEYSLEIANKGKCDFEARMTISGENEVLAIIRDITIEKLAEQELLIAKNKAVESDTLKSTYLHNMSHEIRTPMNAILGFSELLEENNLTHEEQQKFISIIKNSSHQMLSIISNVFAVTEIDLGIEKSKPEAFSVTELLQETYAIFNMQLKNTDIQLELACNIEPLESEIHTDKTKLNQVISNLLDNAIKYTKEGSIRIECTKNKSNYEFTI
jgi:PAS domain S-box-containing protein